MSLFVLGSAAPPGCWAHKWPDSHGPARAAACQAQGSCFPKLEGGRSRHKRPTPRYSLPAGSLPFPDPLQVLPFKSTPLFHPPPKKGCLPLFITLETWALLAVLWRALLDSFIDGGGQTEGCLWRSQPGDAPWRPPMHSTQVRGAEPTPSNRWRLPGFSLDYSVPYAWISRCHNLKIRTRGSP